MIHPPGASPHLHRRNNGEDQHQASWFLKTHL
jgi:hypothetical protein